jgi:group I intron endonuclease
MEALVELHDNIMFYLVIILFGVAWVLISVVRNYVNSKSPISNKYLNHGRNVPIQKYPYVKFSFRNKALTSVRTYSTHNNITTLAKALDVLDLNNKSSALPCTTSIKLYNNAYTMKKDIISENKGKSGIYMWTNLLTGDIYVGQSIDLSKRFRKYFVLKSKEGFIITRALVKYGYVNFSISILEYCDKSILIEREQHYLDSLQPKYNILKLAGSSLGYTHTQESKDKTSKALALGSDGVYTGSKSPLFGRTHSEETIAKMSLNRAGEKNPFYGKLHNEKTIEVMKEKALNRKHTCETKDKMSKSHGEGTSPVNIYEKCSSENFELIGSFVSARRAAKFLDMSGSTVIRYMNSGHVFKERYKFSRFAHD